MRAQLTTFFDVLLKTCSLINSEQKFDKRISCSVKVRNQFYVNRLFD